MLSGLLGGQDVHTVCCVVLCCVEPHCVGRGAAVYLCCVEPISSN
jgi:hypothetical protein